MATQSPSVCSLTLHSPYWAVLPPMYTVERVLTHLTASASPNQHGKVLAFVPLHFVLQGKTCLFLQVSLDFLHLHSSPLWWKGYLFLLLVLEGLIGLHGTVQFWLLRHQWLRHRLGLLWYWMFRLGNEPILFSRFWDCTQVLHFGLFCWLWGLLHFF